MNLQAIIHLFERNGCLLEKTIDNTPAELSLVVVIHLENLLEDERVDAITTFWKSCRPVLALQRITRQFINHPGNGNPGACAQFVIVVVDCALTLSSETSMGLVVVSVIFALCLADISTQSVERDG